MNPAELKTDDPFYRGQKKVSSRTRYPLALSLSISACTFTRQPPRGYYTFSSAFCAFPRKTGGFSGRSVARTIVAAASRPATIRSRASSSISALCSRLLLVSRASSRSRRPARSFWDLEYRDKSRFLGLRHPRVTTSSSRTFSSISAFCSRLFLLFRGRSCGRRLARSLAVVYPLSASSGGDVGDGGSGERARGTEERAALSWFVDEFIKNVSV